MQKQVTLFPGLDFNKYNNGNVNKLDSDDKAFHNWYRFVLSFPPHLVREYIKKFDMKYGETLLDPFCGTGTTIIEAKLNNLFGIGIEANPMAYFASAVKTNFDVEPDLLLKESEKIAQIARKKILESSSRELRTLPDCEYSLLLTDSISPIPLHKTLILLEAIHETNSRYTQHQLLSLATSTVRYASNLHFGPEVGVSKKKKNDVDVVRYWLEIIRTMTRDLKSVYHKMYLPTKLFNGDSRDLKNVLDYNSINAVFTSPPYPNEKDYTRTTRLESIILGFIKDANQLKDIKKNLLRSNTRNVYKNDDDDKFILHNSEIMRIAEEIENRRIALNKTSGFEKTYHKVTKLYFGGIARHLENLKPYLKKNASLGYVVGDQASFLQVYIPTGKIIADIAQDLGYDLIDINLFRTRFATATKKEMREEIVVLKWKG